MGRNKVFLHLVFVLLLFLLTGCWDDVELEDRAFISGVSIDLAEEQGENTTFELMEQLVVPSGLGSTTEAGGGKAYRNLSQTGESLYEINSAISRQANRDITIDHVELVIISQDLARQDGLFNDVIDVFIRQQQMRRGILLAIAEEKAKDLLSIETEHAKIPAQYISELTENRQVPITTSPVRIGDIQESMLNNRSFVVPLLSIYKDNSVNYKGLAIFQGKSSKMVGTLLGKEAKGFNYVLGKEQQGSVTTKVEGDQTTFILAGGTSKIKLLNKDKDQLRFQVDIDVDARLTEYFGELDFYSKGVKEKFKTTLEDKVKKDAEDALKKLKDELQVDAFQFDIFLRSHHYNLWKEVKDDWDHGKNYFSKSDITVQVNANILEPGNSFRVKKKEGEE
ncbi:Ger(x)C family spore germination protein [Oceanobacillus halophilus]|uniref:Ger(x)C family spore germination protein n=1 Tax=Oceanobacillus halophilus TaxID=930130 RepID=UPI0013141D07|nr:Ger(x)C family spore germination protein [Oceanobacillus halophilus]